MSAEEPAPPLAGKTITGPVSARVCLDGRPYLNFQGSGYLALAAVPEIRAAAARGLEEGVPFAQHLKAAASDASDPPFDAVEQAAALACGTETSVYFSSGYFIGFLGLASLEGRYDAIFLDEWAHYSLQDAAALSGMPVHRFRHCDAVDLRASLRSRPTRDSRPLVLTDGVFPVTGRIPPLDEYCDLVAEHDGLLFVDEAHAFGVLGEHGRGALEHCGVGDRASMGATLSKALCAQGAALPCSAQVARRVRRAPQALGASAGSPLSALASAAALAHVSRHPELRAALAANVRYLKAELRRIGLDLEETPAPIAFFKCGSRREMLALQRRVFERGISVGFVSDYVGCDPEGGLRCTVFRDHTVGDIDALIAALG